MNSEKWMNIPGFDVYYMISDYGRVKSLKRTIIMKDGRPRTIPEKILRTGICRGYHHVTIKKTISVHRLVALVFLGPCPDGCEVDHINKDKSDNRVVNLRYVTKRVNLESRDIKGSRNSMAKLTEDLIPLIRSRYFSGESITHIAQSLGVTHGCIHHVVKGISWLHT